MTNLTEKLICALFKGSWFFNFGFYAINRHYYLWMSMILLIMQKKKKKVENFHAKTKGKKKSFSTVYTL